MDKVLRAKPLRSQRGKELEQKCSELKKIGITPTLKVILVGNHPPSLIYTRNKKKFCENLGMSCEILHLPETISEEDLTLTIKGISLDPKVHGCFVQLPLPGHLKHLDVGKMIPAEKDVDGFSPENLYKLMIGRDTEKILLPCTPKGIISLLDFNNIEIEGKDVVVIGRSMIVGKPMQLLLTAFNATVTLCHSKTTNIKQYTSKADIIISAVGIPRFFTKDFLGERRDQVLVDVGMNHDQEGKLCGDMDFDGLIEHVRAITPVPGGVGPLTILSLAENLLLAATLSKETI